MKIAIVAPSPVPFTVGGAEKLWWGALEYINKHTNHHCELIKVPTKEETFWGLIEAYHAFYTLDLSYFDMVITGKYPAWMVQHPNHHIYMLHCLRGLYDCYHFLGLEKSLNTDNPNILHLLQMLENPQTSIEEVFDLLFSLRGDPTLEENFFQFPSAFSRLLIHFFDQKAMQEIQSFSAISKTVANRKEYFPSDAKVEVIYPPSILTDFKNKNYDYFFTISRLDNAKRIDMIIEAYLKSNTNIPLKIAGTGPLSETFQALTQKDDRIEMLGFISDDELMEYYANAYAVLFTPYDEDYGLITIEAMMCEKPLLTFSDSGGVVEFVEEGVTGLVCEPSIPKLTKNIDYLSENEALCKEMGKNAKKVVANITWKNCIERLLEPSSQQISKNKKTKNKKSTNQKSTKKATVVTTYPIYPPRGGGQNRVFYLYKELAKSITVDLVCLVHESESYQKREIAPNLFEIRVPKTQVHAQKEWEIEQKTGIPITDIAMLDLYEETPLLKEKIRESFETSDFLIATQVYTFELCQSITEASIIHDSQNVEYTLKKQMLKETPYTQKLLHKLFQAEKKACLASKFTTVCAYEDALAYEELFGYEQKNTVIVPNGVDLHSVPFVTQTQRESIKKSLGLQDEKIVLFIGSWHQPNIEAVAEIFKMATTLPSYHFIIMGSVGNYFSAENLGTKEKHLSIENLPNNVGFAGVTSDEEKEMYLSVADIAINPMLTGSGTNLKMLDYMANGIPVISTQVGARGLNIPEGCIVVCEIEAFCHYIQEIEQYIDLSKSRKFVEEHFSWAVIQKNLKAHL